MFTKKFMAITKLVGCIKNAGKKPNTFACLVKDIQFSGNAPKRVCFYVIPQSQSTLQAYTQRPYIPKDMAKYCRKSGTYFSNNYWTQLSYLFDEMDAYYFGNVWRLQMVRSNRNIKTSDPNTTDLGNLSEGNAAFMIFGISILRHLQDNYPNDPTLPIYRSLVKDFLEKNSAYIKDVFTLINDGYFPNTENIYQVGIVPTARVTRRLITDMKNDPVLRKVLLDNFGEDWYKKNIEDLAKSIEMHAPKR